jgi:hypothetical protein
VRQGVCRVSVVEQVGHSLRGVVGGYTVHIHYIHAGLKALTSAPHFAHTTVCTVKMTAKTITGSVDKCSI